MFSQFRQAVESLAPVPRHSADGNPPDGHPSQIPRSSSLDSRLSSTLSSSQLAESALVNLRKSLTNQRSASAGQPSRAAGAQENRSKSKLEDRLRAATSNARSGHVTTSSAEALPTTTLHPLSPLDIPLPDSPVNSLEPELLDSPSPPLAELDHFSSLASPASIHSEPADQAVEKGQDAIHSEPVDQALGNGQDAIHSEPSDQASENGQDVIQGLSDSPLTVHTRHDSPPALDSDSPVPATVDELQERLRQVEQRFSGIFSDSLCKKLQ